MAKALSPVVVVIPQMTRIQSTSSERPQSPGEKRVLRPFSTTAYTFLPWRKGTVFVVAAFEERRTPDGEKALPPPGTPSHGHDPHPRWRSRQRLSEGPGRPQSLGRGRPAGRKRRDSQPAQEVRDPRR